MDSHRIGIKFFLADPASLDRSKLSPIFQKWIVEQALAGHMLIDVADYQHVPAGPGVLLVSHEANIAMDDTDGRLGLFYSRKRALGGNFAQRLNTVIGAALHACQKMEHDASVRFSTNEIALHLLDRLNAPNNDGTLEQIKPTVQSLFSTLYESPFTIERRDDPHVPFEVRIKSNSSPTIDDLLHRLSAWRDPFIT